MSQVWSTWVTNQSADNYFGYRKILYNFRHWTWTCRWWGSSGENITLVVWTRRKWVEIVVWCEEDKFLSRFCLSLKLINVTGGLIGRSRLEDKPVTPALRVWGSRTQTMTLGVHGEHGYWGVWGIWGVWDTWGNGETWDILLNLTQCELNFETSW